MTQNYFGVLGSKAIAAFIRNSTSLSQISLYKNHIKPVDVRIIVKALQHNKNVSHFSLTEIGIDTNTALELAETFKINTKFIALGFYACKLGDIGISKIAQSLVLNKNLVLLDLANTGMRNSGATALAEFVKSSTTISILNLDRNGIGDKGMISIGDSLKINTSLEYLTIEYNLFGIAAATTIGKSLVSNNTLKELHFGCPSGHPTNIDLVIEMLEYLKLNRGLDAIVIEAFYVHPEIHFAISNLIRMNKTLKMIHVRSSFRYEEIDLTPSTLAVIDSLLLNDTLRELQLYNPVYWECNQYLNNVLEMNGIVSITDHCERLPRPNVYRNVYAKEDCTIQCN